MNKKHLQQKRSKFHTFLIALVYFFLCNALSSYALEYRGPENVVVGTSDSRLVATIIETENGVTLQVVAIGEMTFDGVEFSFYIKQSELALSDKTFTKVLPFRSYNLDLKAFEGNIDIGADLLENGSQNLKFKLSAKTKYREAGNPWMGMYYSSVEGMDALEVAIYDDENYFNQSAGKITPVFTCYLKKLTPGRLIEPNDLGIGAKDFYTGGRFCPKWMRYGFNLTYSDIEIFNQVVAPELFTYRSPSSVAMDSVIRITGNTAVLNGSFKRGDMLPANNLLDGNKEVSPNVLELQYNGRLDWDQITRRGFIYTTNDVTLRVNQYIDSLYINGVAYPFPSAAEIVAGTFTRGGATFFIVSQANNDAAQSVPYVETISNLQPYMTYYVWSFIDYVFQTSKAYPAISDRISFIAQDDDHGITITPSSNSAFIVWESNNAAESYKLMIYANEKRDEPIYTLEFDVAGQLRSSGNVPSNFSYTVENLSSNTTYYYTLQTFGAGNIELSSKSGEFTTTKGAATGIVEVQRTASQPKVTGYYNVLGGRLPKEPAIGVYIVKYDDGTVVKVVRLK